MTWLYCWFTNPKWLRKKTLWLPHHSNAGSTKLVIQEKCKLWKSFLKEKEYITCKLLCKTSLVLFTIRLKYYHGNSFVNLQDNLLSEQKITTVCSLYLKFVQEFLHWIEVNHWKASVCVFLHSWAMRGVRVQCLGVYCLSPLWHVLLVEVDEDVEVTSGSAECLLYGEIERETSEARESQPACRCMYYVRREREREKNINRKEQSHRSYLKIHITMQARVQLRWEELEWLLSEQLEACQNRQAGSVACPRTELCAVWSEDYHGRELAAKGGEPWRELRDGRSCGVKNKGRV